MQRVVCHMTKAKAGSSGGLSSHIDRSKKEHQANVYSERTPDNFELVKREGSIDDMIKKRLEEGYRGKKAIRKDAVTSCRFILSGSNERMSEIGSDPKAIRQWSKDNYDFFAKRYGEDNIIRATVHMDEKTPHMHLIVVPLTEDGRLSAKEFTGTKKKMRELQDSYGKEVGKKWGLSRGIENSPSKHIDSKDFYKYLNSKDVTAEWILKHPNKEQIVSKVLQDNDLFKELQREKMLSLSDKTLNLNNVKTLKNGIERGFSK